jgi:hypothetical protein
MIVRACLLVLLCGIVSSSWACGSAAPSTPGTDDGDDSPDDDDDGDGVPHGNGHGDGDHSGDGDGDGDKPSMCTNEPGETDITFPMVVDGYYFVTGYAGDGGEGKVVEKSCPTRAGEQRGYCHAFDYQPGSQGWAAMFWQYPTDNWGDRPGRVIPEGATGLSFYAWSDEGGEQVAFSAGMKGKDAFATPEMAITLDKEPKKYTLSLADVAYCDHVISAFVWSAKAQGSFRFYVDDIVWEGENTDQPGDDLPALDPNWPDFSGNARVAVRVRNFCPFPLFVDGNGQEESLERIRLGRGEYHDYDAPTTWTSARVNAYGAATDSDAREKVELTFSPGHVTYNVTYVDFLGLPMEVTSVGGTCAPEEHTTGCSVKQSDVLNGCPQSFLKVGNRCVSPRSYCAGARAGEAYCKRFDDVIASCADCPKASTPEVYACSGAYDNEARWCAAINRGMTKDPDNPNADAYYQNPPYNDYSKWVHEVCPGIYAFPYDDQFSHGGFRDCSGSNEVRITLCPGG